MANKKFSEFTLKTDPANVDFVVGYDGTDNVRIDPSNIGGGATNLNELTDCLVDTDSLYVGEVPSGLSGNPQNNTILGIDSGTALTSGLKNTFIGNDAAKSLTTANENTAVGYQALQNQNTIGNTALGALSGGVGSGGAYSVYVGYKSGQNNATNGHISIGGEAGYSNTSGASNTNIGYQAGYNNTTGSSRTVMGNEASKYNTGNFNVAIGTQAMTGNASGSTHNSSVAIGHQAGASVTGGGQATIVGYQAGAQLTSGWYNTFLGAQAGDNITTGQNNIVIGRAADASSASVNNEITLGDANITSFRIPGIQSGASDGDVLTFNSSAGKLELQSGGGGGASDLNGLSDCEVYTKSGNGSSYFIGTAPATSSTTVGYGFTAVGSDAGAATDMSNSFNYLSSFFGWRAGKSSTTPYQGGITAIGAQAGENNTTGSQWTNIGTGAGQNQNQNGGVAIGYQSCWAATNSLGVAIGRFASMVGSSTSSISIGENSNRSNTATGTVSIGFESGYSNTSGTNNTNLGYKAGYANTTGASNVVMGYEAGRNNTGSYNTLIGVDAARGKTSGSDNVAIGFRALYTETSGQRNTAIGYQALQSQNQQFAAHNTAVGWQADDSNTTGYYRTNIGASTGGNSTGANITNIGFGAQESSSTVSNEVTLGNSSVATLRCAVTSITSLSDERDKTEIKDLGYGLAFIDALQPREFVWDNRPETNKDGEEFYSSNKGKKDFGFIAQEVKELDNDTLRLVYDENPDKLELSYGKLVPVLVQAIKELKEEIELLKSQNK